MARAYKRKRKLWAKANTTNFPINIYRTDLPNHEAGDTNCDDIYLANWLFDEGNEELLDETLLHEMIHVVEFQFSSELKRRNPKGCTQQAIVFGRELSKLQRTLRRV